MKKKILLIDDDALLRRSLGYNLSQAGFKVLTAGTAEEGLDLLVSTQPDLVLLDINLPGIDGLEALKQVREGSSIPVIFVTARRRELDEVLGLELGADDYITKPFDFDVLLARIKKELRKTSPIVAHEVLKQPIQAGNLSIDPATHQVTRSGEIVELSPKEFSLLYCLASNAGRVVPSEVILREVWGNEFIGEPQVLYVHIRWLRKKIEDNPQRPSHILTVRGIGYKLV